MTPQGILTRSYALGHTTRRQQGLFLRRSIWLTAVGVVFLFCYVQGATAAIALVQKVTNANASPGASSIAATLPAAVAGGNLMVVAVDGWPNDGTSVPSSFTITESRSNSYSIAGVIQAGNSNMYSALYMRGVVAAQSAKNPATTPLAQTPPMGWNSWNKFACNVSESLIRETADALVSSGMWAAGYQYVNIDDCWQESRDAQGNIVADPARFPSGIKALADYVHGKGLKLGIYTDAGTFTCQRRPGSLNYEAQDAKTYAAWGIDYVKIDWCNAEGLVPEVQYAKFRDALAQSGRPIVFSICNWGVKAPWRWGPTTGNLWRTTDDINDTYDRMSLIGFSQNGLEKFAGPGHWNDPDMLEVGNGGMKPDEYRTHIALWALLAAPLLAGNDLRSMSAETKELLTNSEIIAVDQDSKGVQGHRVWQEGPLEIWAKPLADGSQAVGLFNRGESAINMTLDFRVIGAPESGKLRNLLDHKDLGTLQYSYTTEVPKHGVVLVRVSK